MYLVHLTRHSEVDVPRVGAVVVLGLVDLAVQVDILLLLLRSTLRLLLLCLRLLLRLTQLCERALLDGRRHGRVVVAPPGVGHGVAVLDIAELRDGCALRLLAQLAVDSEPSTVLYPPEAAWEDEGIDEAAEVNRQKMAVLAIHVPDDTRQLIEDEILYREGQSLSLAEGDPVLKRRMIAQMRLLMASAAPPHPDDAALEDLLAGFMRHHAAAVRAQPLQTRLCCGQ